MPIADPGVLRQDCFRFRATRLAASILCAKPPTAGWRLAAGGYRLSNQVWYFLSATRHGGLASECRADCCPRGEAVRRQLELEPAPTRFHSLRAAHATVTAIPGASERSMMRQTGHRSVQPGRASLPLPGLLKFGEGTAIYSGWKSVQGEQRGKLGSYGCGSARVNWRLERFVRQHGPFRARKQWRAVCLAGSRSPLPPKA
jgi:hypothetical protein